MIAESPSSVNRLDPRTLPTIHDNIAARLGTQASTNRKQNAIAPRGRERVRNKAKEMKDWSG